MSARTPAQLPYVVNGFGGDFKVLARMQPHEVAISTRGELGGEIETASFIVEACNSYAGLRADNAELSERLLALEGQRRLWLDNDNNARVMVSQEKAIEALTGNLAHLRSANAALAEALAKLVAQFEDMDENMPTNAGCIECTAGTVPDNRNTGLCGYHAAKKLLATTQAKAQEGAG